MASHGSFLASRDVGVLSIPAIDPKKLCSTSSFAAPPPNREPRCRRFGGDRIAPQISSPISSRSPPHILTLRD
jgi:hypothetical protein